MLCTKGRCDVDLLSLAADLPLVVALRYRLWGGWAHMLTAFCCASSRDGSFQQESEVGCQETCHHELWELRLAAAPSQPGSLAHAWSPTFFWSPFVSIFFPLALMAAGTSIFCSVKMTCCLWTTGCSTQRLTPCQSTTQTSKLKQACNSEAIAQHPAPTTSAGYCISFPLKEFVLFLKWYFGALVQFRTVFYWEDETMT